MDMFYKLWDGEVGSVVEVRDWNEDECVSEWKGKRYNGEEVVGGIDEWLEGKDLSKLELVRDDGYRGIGCYGGWMELDGLVYWLDIMNEYEVWEMREIKS